MKSDAVRGNRTSLRIVSVILAVLCVFSVFAVRAIRMRPVQAKQEVWIEQAESSEELAGFGTAYGILGTYCAEFCPNGEILCRTEKYSRARSGIHRGNRVGIA